MATSESESADVDAQSPSMNEIAVKAIRQGIAEQAERQEDFQLSVRIQESLDEEAAKQFHQDLIEFIKQSMEAGDVSFAEVAIALWDEVNRMEKMVQKAREKMEKDAEDDESNTNDDGSDSTVSGLARQPSTDGDEKEDTEEADSTADPDLPEDPAFH